MRVGQQCIPQFLQTVGRSRNRILGEKDQNIRIDMLGCPATRTTMVEFVLTDDMHPGTSGPATLSRAIG